MHWSAATRTSCFPISAEALSIETLVAAVIRLLAGSGAYRGRAADRLGVKQGENLT